MVAADEDALICDFAETYHIYDYRQLKLAYAATLANGLRDSSRIKAKLTEQRVSTETLLMGAAVDALNLLVWMQSKDGQKNRNRPVSVVEMLTADNSKKVKGFESAEEFERAREVILWEAKSK